MPHFYHGRVEAGCDEAGRGCLAGSVYAAAVILPENYDNPSLNDSKCLSPHQREALRLQIQQDAVSWAVGKVSPGEIDQINILHASFLAMHRALDQLGVRPEALIIDGNRFDPYFPRLSGKGRSAMALPTTCIVKGDGRYQAIAAASILAKTFRDAEMEKLASQYPQYGWQNNKGYPTREHWEAIQKYGITPYHRKSYHYHGQNLSAVVKGNSL